MDRSKEIVRVSIVGILVNLFLVAVKAVIGFLAHSTSVLLDAVQKELTAYPSVLQMHGFYADTEKKAVSFDIVMDFAEKHQTELAEKIRTSLTEQFPEYHFMIVLDKDFTN